MARISSAKPKRFGGRLEHAQALGHHFLADAVAGDRGDAEMVGSCILLSAGLRRARLATRSASPLRDRFAAPHAPRPGSASKPSVFA